MCWRGTSLSTISSVLVPIFFSGQRVVLIVDAEGVAFRPRAVVAGKGVASVVVAGCARIFTKICSRKVTPGVGYMQ